MNTSDFSDKTPEQSSQAHEKSTESKPEIQTENSSQTSEKEDSFSPIKVVEDIKRMLYAVSLCLIVGASVLSLDFLPGTLLGCAIVIFNFDWTVRLVKNLLIKKTLNPAILLAYLTKLGISGVVLYVAINLWEFSAMGLIIGLSSVVITTLAYSVLTTLRV